MLQFLLKPSEFPWVGWYKSKTTEFGKKNFWLPLAGGDTYWEALNRLEALVGHNNGFQAILRRGTRPTQFKVPCGEKPGRRPLGGDVVQPRRPPSLERSRRLLEHMREPLTVKAIAELVGLKPERTRLCLLVLETAGLVIRAQFEQGPREAVWVVVEDVDETTESTS